MSKASEISINKPRLTHLLAVFWPPEITASPYGVTALVVYNGNMDYLRCPDKLSWRGAHTCKEAEKKK